MQSLQDLKIIFLCGPTASGKTRWALEWVQRFGGSIWNCDSIQTYQDLDIGSAKPTVLERSLCPHFLFDFVRAPQELTAGEYRRVFFETLYSLSRQESPLLRGPLFVVGGTGFYFQALEKGLFEVPPSRAESRRPFEDLLQTPGGQDKLFQMLQEKDPLSAVWIKPQDHYRLVRALELLALGFIPSHEKEKKKTRAADFPGDLLKIGLRLDKERYRNLIEQRTSQMLQQGLIQEVERMFELGFQDWAPLQSVGYQEVREYLLQGRNESLESLRSRINQGTMKLIKKQKTWFQRDSEIQWFAPLEKASMDEAVTLVQTFLDKPLTG